MQFNSNNHKFSKTIIVNRINNSKISSKINLIIVNFFKVLILKNFKIKSNNLLKKGLAHRKVQKVILKFRK